MAKVRRKLLGARDEQSYVQLDRVSRKGQSVDGFVVAVGRRWVLVQRVMDGGFFDGYVVLRLREIRRVRLSTSFQGVFARSQPEWPPAAPSGLETLDLDRTRGVLEAMSARGGLFGIERDRKHDAVWIGVFDEVVKPYLYLWEVGPDASWHEVPQGYKIRTIMMFVFDDHYQRGLASVAGPAPTAS